MLTHSSLTVSQNDLVNRSDLINRNDHIKVVREITANSPDLVFTYTFIVRRQDVGDVKRTSFDEDPKCNQTSCEIKKLQRIPSSIVFVQMVSSADPIKSGVWQWKNLLIIPALTFADASLPEYGFPLQLRALPPSPVPCQQCVRGPCVRQACRNSCNTLSLLR